MPISVMLFRAIDLCDEATDSKSVKSYIRGDEVWEFLRTWIIFFGRAILPSHEIDLSAETEIIKNRGGCLVDLCSHMVRVVPKNKYSSDSISIYLKLLASFFRLGPYFSRYRYLSAETCFLRFWMAF